MISNSGFSHMVIVTSRLYSIGDVFQPPLVPGEVTLFCASFTADVFFGHKPLHLRTHLGFPVVCSLILWPVLRAVDVPINPNELLKIASLRRFYKFLNIS